MSNLCSNLPNITNIIILHIFISVIFAAISFVCSIHAITEKWGFFLLIFVTVKWPWDIQSFDISLKVPLKDQGLLRCRICSFFLHPVHMVLRLLLVRLGDLLIHTMLWFNDISIVGVLKYLCHRKSSVQFMNKFLK